MDLNKKKASDFENDEYELTDHIKCNENAEHDIHLREENLAQPFGLNVNSA